VSVSGAALDARSRRIADVGYDYASRETEAVDACNLCGSTNQIDVASRDRYGYPARAVRCADCGLVFLNPRLTAGEYGRFYGSTYRPLVSAFHGRRIDAETVQEEQRVYAGELVAFLHPLLPQPPRTVLDIGGSTGVVASAFRDAFGSSAIVLDPSAAELAVAAAAGLATVAGFAEDFDPGDERFDLVLLCQTIDHLLDIRGTVASIRRALADPDGRAFIDVLDFDLAVERAGSLEGAIKIDHPYSLNDATSRAFFAQAGLAVIADRLSSDGHRGYVLAIH